MKYCILIVVLIIKSVAGQPIDTSLVETNLNVKKSFNSCKFIFEGKVIHSITLPNENNDKVYNFTTVEIEKIYRGGGKIKKGTVILVERNYSPNVDIAGASSPLGMNVRTLFLCDYPKEPPIKFQLYADNNFYLTFDNEVYFVYFIVPLFKNYAWWSPWRKAFRNDYQFNKYIKQFSNIDTLSGSNKQLK